MSIFNVISGTASIGSFLLGIWVLRVVYSLKVKINLTDNSEMTVKQTASGRAIKQAGRDVNGG